MATVGSRGPTELHRTRTWLLESAGSHVSLGVLTDGAGFGQPCCELVLTGIGLDVDALQRHLDECIITEAERCAGVALGPDPFREAFGDTVTPA